MEPKEASASDAIGRNVAVHDALVGTYEALHGEIFNEIEQARLRATIEAAVARHRHAGHSWTALDVGCGTGNLVRHLVDLGAAVTAADVSPRMVRHCEVRWPEVRGLVLNGADLSEIEDGAFDFVACYSVLHHVPDYLALVAEMGRVASPGGVVLIDHECSPEYWTPSAAYTTLRESANPTPWLRASRWFTRAWWAKRRLKRLSPGEVQGDIHVYPHDHIEWDAVRQTLAETGCGDFGEEDYLLFRSGYRVRDWERARATCSDMRCLTATKGLPA